MATIAPEMTERDQVWLKYRNLSMQTEIFSNKVKKKKNTRGVKALDQCRTRNSKVRSNTLEILKWKVEVEILKCS